MTLQHFPAMVESIKNGSLPIGPTSDAQASILDLVLFPGFTRISTAVQEHLAVDLNFYFPLLCIFGLFVFVCRRFCEYFLEWLEIYYTSTVHVKYREEVYDMLLWWVSTQCSTQHTRSSLATTDCASASTQVGSPNKKQKTIFYAPWNGRFFVWYKGRLLVFRREYRAGEFNSREEVSISCFSRSPRILRELLTECYIEYSKLVRDKTSLYEHQDGIWARSIVLDIRPMSTVILNKNKKTELLKDIEDFLNPVSRQWYSNRGIPYRKGYLLYGPPGTGKSSLSSSIAGHIGLDIYILSLSTVTEDRLRDLFARLPSSCVILLEDIDAVSSTRSGNVTIKDSHQSKHVVGRVPLSALLNIIDGVGSQEGRILIMTTNHITRLDKALIRPGRADKKVELGLADREVMAGLFCLVFEPVKGDISSPKNAQSDVLVGDEGEVEGLKQLAKDFAVKMPELEFSPAEILSFLLEHRQSPKEAIDNMEAWMTGIREEREMKNEVLDM